MTAGSVLVVEPYFGGSHRVWAEGIRDHLGLAVELLTLPPRWWKWRIRGAAVTLAEQLATLDFRPEAVIVSDMIDLPAFLTFTRRHLGDVPVAMYFHESQLTYPDSPHMEPDLSYAVTNWLSALAADTVWFNSRFHRDVFFEELPRLLRHFPDHTHEHLIPRVRERSEVLEPGIDLGWAEAREDRRGLARILWNHRWEHDKDPVAFFDAIDVLAAENHDFEIVVCGENFRVHAEEFTEAARRHPGRIVHLGHAPVDRYRQLLLSADVVVSTARQEFFGIAIVEAMAAGAMPLVPDRLSYPELVPIEWHHHCLYAPGALVDRLRRAVLELDDTRRIGAAIAPSLRRFDWSAMAPRYLAAVERLVERSPASRSPRRPGGGAD